MVLNAIVRICTHRVHDVQVHELHCHQKDLLPDIGSIYGNNKNESVNRT